MTVKVRAVNWGWFMVTAYELEIYEWAEHWVFYETVETPSQQEAFDYFKKNYRRGYSLRGIRPCRWS